MTEEIFAQMEAAIDRAVLTRPVGQITQIAGGTVQIGGFRGTRA